MRENLITLQKYSNPFYIEVPFKVLSAHQLHYWNSIFFTSPSPFPFSYPSPIRECAQQKKTVQVFLWLTLIIKKSGETLYNVLHKREGKIYISWNANTEKPFKKSLHLFPSFSCSPASYPAPATIFPQDFIGAIAVRVYVVYGVEIYSLRFTVYRSTEMEEINGKIYWALME